MTYQLV